MRDHFVVLVELLITESTLEAAIESLEQADIRPVAAPSAEPDANFVARKNSGVRGASGELVECRICQDEDEDEDEDSSMEIPCSCCGSLKYAHRTCVQRWCNEKGDTLCEICLQQFKPGYTSPPKLFRYGRIPMSSRGNWEISRRDINNQQFITMVQTNRDFAGSSGFDDSALASSTRSIMYCRLVAVTFMTLVILCHALPFVIGGAEEYSLALFILFLLKTAGIVLPLYVMLRAVTTFQSRHLQQGMELVDSSEAAFLVLDFPFPIKVILLNTFSTLPAYLRSVVQLIELMKLPAWPSAFLFLATDPPSNLNSLKLSVF